MTATETPIARPAVPAGATPLPQEIDYSCRVPLMFLFGCSLAWLIVSLVFGIVASVKMHAPGMLANIGALTYGRVAAVSSSTLLYGFASQAGIAIALWLFARMGKTFLVLPGGSFVAGLLWNAGVLAGNVGILSGGLTQHPAYQMPYWSTPFFFVSFVVLGLSALLTFSARLERELYPSNWFLFAAFFVFPWILSVAYLLLGRYPIRGVLEPVIGIWFANNFVMLWLGSIALAVIFYFVSKLSNQPLYSYSMATFSFWFYLLFSTASGFQNTPGLPNWLPNLSRVTNTLVWLPVAVIIVNWHKTWAGHNRARKQKDISSKYVSFAAVAFVLAMFFRALLSCPEVDEPVGLTIFKAGALSWTLYGFIAMAFFAGILHIVPRLVEVDWPSPAMSSAHFGLTVAGTIIVTAALMLGGYVEGNSMNSPGVPFNTVIKQSVPYIGMNSIGLLLLLLGQIALFVNFLLLSKAAAVNCCGFSSREVVR